MAKFYTQLDDKLNSFILEQKKYVGSLQNQTDDFQLVLRPSFKF